MRYAPADEHGSKPYVVERSEWGLKTTYIVYAETASGAAYMVKGRQRHVVAHAHRATPVDIETYRAWR